MLNLDNRNDPELSVAWWGNGGNRLKQLKAVLEVSLLSLFLITADRLWLVQISLWVRTTVSLDTEKASRCLLPINVKGYASSPHPV